MSDFTELEAEQIRHRLSKRNLAEALDLMEMWKARATEYREDAQVLADGLDEAADLLKQVEPLLAPGFEAAEQADAILGITKELPGPALVKKIRAFLSDLEEQL